MASKEFPLTPVAVDPVETVHRRIKTAIPVPESVSTLEELRKAEPRSMGGQPPILWQHGEGAYIRDPYGNQWIDFSAGVLVTSVGHNHPKVVDAIVKTASQSVYHAYAFPTDIRTKLTRKLQDLVPDPLSRIFLLTTGSEATECALKLAKTKALEVGGPQKRLTISFDNAFHGRTMGSQLAGGIPGLKGWIGCKCPDYVSVPYPDGFRCPDTSFDLFLSSLEKLGVLPSQVAAVISETYQGCNAALMPAEYAQALRKWCDENQVSLIFDEVQAGFGRTGKLFGFNHYGIVPDAACFGKGISGGMPLSAVAATEELMSLYGPGEMSSTHSANPVCAAAALANIEVILEENLIDNAATLGQTLKQYGQTMKDASNGHIGQADGVGLVISLQFVQPGTTTPDPDAAFRIVEKAIQRGVMLFAPVGVGGGAIKINPPLNINHAQLTEGLEVTLDIVKEEF